MKNAYIILSFLILPLNLKAMKIITTPEPEPEGMFKGVRHKMVTGFSARHRKKTRELTPKKRLVHLMELDLGGEDTERPFHFGDSYVSKLFRDRHKGAIWEEDKSKRVTNPFAKGKGEVFKFKYKTYKAKFGKKIDEATRRRRKLKEESEKRVALIKKEESKKRKAVIEEDLKAHGWKLEEGLPTSQKREIIEEARKLLEKAEREIFMEKTSDLLAKGKIPPSFAIRNRTGWMHLTIADFLVEAEIEIGKRKRKELRRKQLRLAAERRRSEESSEECSEHGCDSRLGRMVGDGRGGTFLAVWGKDDN